MHLATECLVPIQVLIQQQATWILEHEIFIGVGGFIAMIGFLLFILELLGAIDWDGFGRATGAFVFIVGLIVFGVNTSWRSTAANNPIYYAYASCPARFAAPERPVALPFPEGVSQ